VRCFRALQNHMEITNSAAIAVHITPVKAVGVELREVRCKLTFKGRSHHNASPLMPLHNLPAAAAEVAARCLWEDQQ
jgi:hypothetical protein